ncbi:hypothetical protein G9401_05360 [Weissella paramesenteroides]|nr:hypothetical protein [Weissella paramesenteroides]
MALQNHLQVAKLSKQPSSDKNDVSIVIHGIQLDSDGRCLHYHTNNDIVALKCAQCHQYFACYQCHDAIMSHEFMPANPEDKSVMCGVCHHIMNYQDYSQNSCPNCHHAFNPRCALHHEIYFES